MGIDYYLYVPPASECPIPTLYRALESIMETAHNPEELHQNIRAHKPYKDGHSAVDLIDLSGFRSEVEICKNFSAALAYIAEHSYKERIPSG